MHLSKSNMNKKSIVSRCTPFIVNDSILRFIFLTIFQSISAIAENVKIGLPYNYALSSNRIFSRIYNQYPVTEKIKF